MMKTNNHKEREQKLIANIFKNYRQIEQSIVNQLYMRNDFHGSNSGTAREDIWAQLFEMIIPKKFVIEQSVFIIDSEGNVSNEVDLAIIDELYTPYIFRYGRLKFIPIEAVLVVVECKSKHISNIKKWSENISKLKTANESIARMAVNISISAPKTQQSTRPIRILCRVGSEVRNEVAEHFDFVLSAVKKSVKKKKVERIIVKVNKDMTLYDWFGKLNFHNVELPNDLIKDEDKKTILKTLQGTTLSGYEVRDENDQEVSLLTFNFQLNQLLMLINNPIPFPHRKYVEFFNRKE